MSRSAYVAAGCGLLVWGLLAWGVLMAVGCGPGTDNPVEADGERDLQVGFTLGACDPGAAARRAVEGPDGWTTVSDGAVQFHHSLGTYCSAVDEGALDVQAVVDGTTITITEIFRGRASRCVCAIPVQGTIGGLDPGTYTVIFVYGVDLEGQDYEPELLHETTAEVLEPGA